MRQVIGGKLYDTETATLIASDRYWDGHNWERHGRNTYLYRTPKGTFFLAYTTLWQGERDHLEALDKEGAKEWYERLPEIAIDYIDAFGEVPEDA